MNEEFIGRRTALKAIGAAGISGTLLSSVGTADTSDGSVSRSTARQIASNAVEYLQAKSEFDDWRPQGVTASQVYHAKVQTETSVEYVPRAWVFAIENRGEDVGYIAIDADQAETPVLAYGRATAPHKRVEGAKSVASAHGVSVRDRFLYHGGVTFGIETSDRRIVDLRGGWIRRLPAVENADNLKPNVDPGETDTEDDGVTTQKEKENAPDWSGDTDDSISYVPNWTETDESGATYTSYGTGDDSWDKWDGCTPIAGSMAIGYHEYISDSEAEEREALIDRLHDDMNTNDSGVTEWWDIDNGISSYEEGYYSYNGNNNHFNIKGNIVDAVGANEPPLLNMSNGPYTQNSDWLDGHSVTVVGYRDGSDYFYHKVHNGYDESPDRVSNGNWSDACVTRISKA